MVRDVVITRPDFWREKYRTVCRKDYECHRDPAHGPFITFDLGCDSDCALDNMLTANRDYHGHVVEVMNQVADIPGAMTSFATKSAFIEPFIAGCTRPERCRIRLSIMPEHHRAMLECGTSKISDRLHAVNALAEAGFEVHINLSPIVVTRDFVNEYSQLLQLIDRTLTDTAKAQLAYEIIFLTHSDKVFDAVSTYAPKAHRAMAEGPLPLVPKPNKPNVLSYDRKHKRKLKQALQMIINRRTPYARVRYAF